MSDWQVELRIREVAQFLVIVVLGWLARVARVGCLGCVAGCSVVAAQERLSDVTEFSARCEAAAVGETVGGYLELIRYQAGSLPLILAAPHGGSRVPAEYELRTEGTRIADANTDRLARAVAEEVSKMAQARPHLVVCELHRKFLDANRPLDSACSAESLAVRNWYEYQQALKVAKQRVVSELGRGLFIELHGHGHSQKRLELGYLLRERDFELPFAEFEQLKTKASVREIAEHGQLSLEELIRGESSLGGMLEREGLVAVPGVKVRSPGEDLYFNGGWNTMTHGSRDSGTISSIQIECHREGFRDSDVSIARSAKQLAAAMVKFLELHYATRSQAGK